MREISDPSTTTPDLPALRRVMYVSRVVSPGLGLDDLDILRVALRRNAEDGITGFLHRDDEVFVQVVEGAPEALEDLLGRLHRDTRHYDMRILADETITERQFADWSMGVNEIREAPVEVRSNGGNPVLRWSYRVAMDFLSSCAEFQRRRIGAPG